MGRQFIPLAHQTLKNRILLEDYYLPGDLRQKIEAFVDHYNHRRYHESLQNLTPADVYFGQAEIILKQRERIKRKGRPSKCDACFTANPPHNQTNQMGQTLSYQITLICPIGADAGQQGGPNGRLRTH